MKIQLKKVFVALLITLMVTSSVLITANASNEGLVMYFTQNGEKISSITIAPGESVTVGAYINVEGATVRFSQSAVAGINLRASNNTVTVKVADDMPDGTWVLLASYNGYSVIIDIIVQHKCNYVSEITLEPTCLNTGVATHTCSICGCSYVTSVPELGHIYSITVVEPTCTHEGYTEYKCNNCTYSYIANKKEEIPHDVVTIPAKAATCTTTGLTEGTKCSVCNTTINKQKTVEKLEHNYTEWSTIVPSTCIKEGKEQRTCKKCNDVEVNTIKKTKHKLSKVKKVAATTKKKGVKAHYKCSGCNKLFSDATGKNKVTKSSLTIPVVKAAPKGSTIKDKNGNKYKVTKSSVKNGTVSYMSPKNKKVTSVNIPDNVTIDGVKYKVTSIGKNAFVGCNLLKKITIGKNVSTINSKAFYKCKSLRSITINSKLLKVKSIGKDAFKGIKKNVTIKVPKSKYKAYKTMFVKKGINTKAKFTKI